MADAADSKSAAPCGRVGSTPISGTHPFGNRLRGEAMTADGDRLRPGLTQEATYTVTPDMRPPHVEGILATSRMIGLVEDTCLALVQPLLPDGETTVGTRVDVTHVGTARAGELVTVRVRLTSVRQRRLLGFEIEVEAPAGIISTGTHQRLVVDRERFTRPPERPTSSAGP
jgi:fluoroacetyl-CoA thioesterase